MQVESWIFPAKKYEYSSIAIVKDFTDGYNLLVECGPEFGTLLLNAKDIDFLAKVGSKLSSNVIHSPITSIEPHFSELKKTKQIASLFHPNVRHTYILFIFYIA